MISGLPEGCVRSQVAAPGLSGEFVTIPESALHSSGGAAFELVRPLRWMALERYVPWWPRPVFGSGKVELDGEFLLILWEREAGGYGVALPLVDGDVRGILNGATGGLTVQVPENDPRPDFSTLLFIAMGADPLELVPWAVRKISERMGTFQMRTEKAPPEWVDYLGWCTWDAFGPGVTAEKVLDGLASFKAGGFSPRFLILDDGWQDEKEGQLWSFRTHAQRFPHGLKPLVDQARTEYGVKLFGVWHALEGYWNGVHPDGELAGEYHLAASEGVAYNCPNSAFLKRSMVHPSDIARFYNDYYRILRSQGVDMVKVDNQASLDHFCNREVPPTATMLAYQMALQDAEQVYFHGESLHCMSNTTDAAYSLKSASVWRSSQDFFPMKPETQALHIFDNAINSIWVQTFALPDWDMFQSDHPAGAFHAASRAISGGPIYVSDKPGHHNFGLLAKLMMSDGKILRCQQPALPARESLFEDGRALPRVTKIVNFNEVGGQAIGVLGLFNCFYSEAGPEEVSGDYSAADISCISGSRFALYHHTSGLTIVAGSSDRFPMKLQPLGYELVTVSPLVDGIALFGLIDKFNGSRALVSMRWLSPNALELVLADGGRIGWCSERRGETAATWNESPVKVSSQNGLFWVRIPEGAPATLIISFA